MRGYLALALAWVTAWGLSACGGGGDEAAPVAPVTAVAGGQGAAQTLGPAGGTLLLATREGARFTLTVPAGALTTATALHIETAEAPDAQRFHLRLLPAGLLFAQGRQATLDIALPASLQATASTALLYYGVPVPSTLQPDGALRVQLAGFAGTAAGPSSGARREHAQSARAIGSSANGPVRPLATSAATCNGLPRLGIFDDASLTASDAVDVEVYGHCMLAAVQALAANRQFQDAVRLANATAAFLQSTGSGDALAVLTEARRVACSAYREVLDDALQTRLAELGRLNDLVRPILYWETAVQQLGAVCTPEVAVAEYQDVINAKAAEVAAVYAQRKGAIVDVDGVEYTEAVAEARESATTLRQVQALQPPAQVAEAARQAIAETAQPALLDAMLQPPWQRCRDSGDMTPLMELMLVMDSPAAVRNAAQYCGTQLAARAVAADGRSEVAVLTPALGGTSATAQAVTTNAMQVDAAGTLVLSGPIRALACPAVSAGIGTPEALELRLDGVLLQTLATGPYLAEGLTLSLADALRNAGIDAARFESARLTLHRTGNPCGGFWGEAPAPLLSLDLQGGRDVLLLALYDASREPAQYQYTANYLRILEVAYGRGRAILGDASEGATLFRPGRDVVVVGTAAGSTDALAWVAARTADIEPWLRAGGRLLMQQTGLGFYSGQVTQALGLQWVVPGPGTGAEATYTVTWPGGGVSLADSVLWGRGPYYDTPTRPLAAMRITGHDVNLMWDDDNADGWTDDPAIWPFNFDNVGQGEAVAARRNVGAGRVVATTLNLPWGGFGTLLDPAYQVILSDLRGR